MKTKTTAAARMAALHSTAAGKASILAAIAAATGAAADVNFNNAAGDRDLANAANWSSTWSYDNQDALVVSTANFTWPDAGLRFSSDLSPKAFALKFNRLPDKNVTVDFGGHSLNSTLDIFFGAMHAEANRNYYLLATGGFSGVERLRDENSFGNVRFTNGTYTVQRGLHISEWYPAIWICDGAELVFAKVRSDGSTTSGNGIFLDSNASYADFRIDGGKVVIKGRNSDDANWLRACWMGRPAAPSTFKVLNGGEYRDDTTIPQSMFLHVNFTVKDAGYYETNSTHVTRNTCFLGSGMRYEITNSIFRVAQLYLGQYGNGDSTYGYEIADFRASGCTVDFCDSEETFAFAPGCSKTTAGMVVPATARNNTIRFRGERNRFASKTFVLGGSNTVAVTGGRFAVSNSFGLVSAPPGSGSMLILKDADVFLGALTASATASNTIVEVSGAARVKGNGDFATGGPGSAMRVADGAVVDIGAHRFSLLADGSSLFLGGLCSTGAISFTANDCTATLVGTTNRTVLGAEWTRLPPLSFEANKANNVLVISNATYDCQGPFGKEIVSNTGDGLGQEITAYTQCPGCRIELRGSSPKFMVSSRKASASAGYAWYSMALGEMFDSATGKYTATPYALDNPVRIRFVFPKADELYAEAPVRGGGIVVLGGNAEFEFDMSEFDWPTGRFTIPLVYSDGGFQGDNSGVVRTYIDVAGLNAANASRMPVNPYGQVAGKFALSEDGKTLNLTLNNSGGTVFFVREEAERRRRDRTAATTRFGVESLYAPFGV